MQQSSLSIENILGSDGMLSRYIPGFETRSSQLEMARLIAGAISQGECAIVEAGTGTGKTFGYLVPALISGKKVVISTGTRNLQDQIYHKDIPLLRKATSSPIDAVIMKGRKNYLCLHRYHQHFQQGFLLQTEQAQKQAEIEKWLRKTRFADLSELPWLSDQDPLRDALSASSDQCIGADCMFLEDCYLGKLRARAAQARIIIVNHHLFFADMKVKQGGFGEIIPRFQVAVFDEAHGIEEIATTHFGESISTRQIGDFLKELETSAKLLATEDRVPLETQVSGIKGAVANLRTFFEGPEPRGRIGPENLALLRNGPAKEIRFALNGLLAHLERHVPDREQWIPMADRAAELNRLMEEIVSKRDAAWLNWYELRKRSLVLHTSPLDVSALLVKRLYEKTQSVILTSATLSTDNTFQYIRSRLGFPEDALEGLYTSHFDFSRQALLYLPQNLPAPGAHDFAYRAGHEVQQILEKSKGRALVLFTSYQNLHRVSRILGDDFPYTVYRQGDAPRNVLLEKFKKDVNSVLLATGSFWQGVDVPGEALSCLIIDKLPFASPGDPLVAARIESIRAGGGNPFMDYQVPSAIIALKQGVGRLIRNASDRGIVAILDKRLTKSRYGRAFLNSLPQMRVTHERDDLKNFLSEL